MRKIPPIIILMALALSFLPAQSREQLFDQGLGAFQDKLYEDALANFTTYLERYGTESRADAALYMSGVALYSLGRYDQSLETFDRLRNDKVDSPYLRRTSYWQGLAYYSQEEWDLAEEAFSEQLGHSGETYYVERSFLYLGLLREKRADWEGAAESYARLIGLSGNTDLVTQAFYRRGLVYLNREEYERALPNFEKLSADYGSSPYTRAMPYYIGLCYLNLDQPEEARRRFELYLRLFPSGEYREAVLLQLARAEGDLGNRARALELLAELKDRGRGDLALRARNMEAENYSALGNTQKARSLWLELLEEESRPEEKDRIRYNIGLTWLKEGNREEASARFRETLSLMDSPVRRDSLEALAALYLEEGEKELALGYGKTLFDDYPDYERREEAGAMVAALMMELDRADMVEAHLKTMVEEYRGGEKNDLYLMMLSQSAMDREEWTEALAWLGQLESGYPSSEYRDEALYRLGYIYILREEYIRGAAYLEELLAMDRDLTPQVEEDSRYSLALANYKGGKEGEALVLFEEYLNLYGGTERAGEIALYMGNIRFDRREWSRAAVLFSRAADILSDNGSDLAREAAFKEALARQKNREWALSGDLFLALARAVPSDRYGEEALYQAGVCRLEEGFNGEARSLFGESGEKGSEDIRERSIYQLARLALGEDNREEALRLALLIRKEFPSSDLGVHLFFSEAEDYWALGDYEKAREWYLLCDEVFPEQSVVAQASLRASLALAETGKTEEAVDELYRDLVENLTGMDRTGGNNHESQGRATALGRLLTEGNSKDKAAAILESMRDLTEDRSVLAPLVIAAERTGSGDEEMPALLEELYRTEELPFSLRTEALLLLGRYRIGEGEPEEGEALYRVVMESDKGNLGAEANFMLGLLLSQDDPAAGAQELLNVSYNYPAQEQWASRALLSSWEIYSSLEGEERKAEIVRDKLLSLYPDSEEALSLADGE